MVAGVISDCAFAELRLVIQAAAEARGFPNWTSPLIGWLAVVFASAQMRVDLFQPTQSGGSAKSRRARCSSCMRAPIEMYLPFRRANYSPPRRSQKNCGSFQTRRIAEIEEVASDEYRTRVIDFLDRLFAA